MKRTAPPFQELVEIPEYLKNQKNYFYPEPYVTTAQLMKRCNISCHQKFYRLLKKLGLKPSASLALCSTSKSAKPRKRFAPLAASKFLDDYRTMQKESEDIQLTLKDTNERIDKMSQTKSDDNVTILRRMSGLDTDFLVVKESIAILRHQMSHFKRVEQSLVHTRQDLERYIKELSKQMEDNYRQINNRLDKLEQE